MTLQSIAKRLKLVTKTIETKSGVQNISENIGLRHNNIVVINSALLRTQTGTEDVENSFGNRIGDQIALTSMQFKIMFELNEAFTDVTVRIMVVRSAKGDTPQIGNLFMNQSVNKMLDTFNSERFSILFQKYIRLRSNPAAIPVCITSPRRVAFPAHSKSVWDTTHSFPI